MGSLERDLESDASLLSRLRSGEPQAFEMLVRTHTPRLLAVAQRLLRNEEDAKDAVQEAFLNAFRSLGSFEGASRVSTWLHRIAVNVALMKLRSQRRKPEASIEGLLPAFLEDGHHALHPPEWRDGADVLLERREDREFIRACIDELPESHRTVLILRDVEELDPQETARALGVTENVVKVRLHRARQALRSLLEPRFRRGVA
ncbi:MAG TPA: sigma-70 family RNA polymerase sigma factor [Vicinamibacteria bacterium]|nr:sigma-70 family RNA polymerase sigma factor [Vicinamibacteria bacterium]